MAAKQTRENPGSVHYRQFSEKISDTRSTREDSLSISPSWIGWHNLSPAEVLELLHDKQVVVLRRSYRDQILTVILFGITLIMAIVLTPMQPYSVIGVVPMYFFIPLALLMVILHQRYNSKYVIGDRYITIFYGIWSWEMKRLRIEIEGLKAIETVKTILGRILNAGDIRLSTIMFDQPEIDMKGVPNPLYFSALIRLAKEAAIKAKADEAQNGDSITVH